MLDRAHNNISNASSMSETEISEILFKAIVENISQIRDTNFPNKNNTSLNLNYEQFKIMFFSWKCFDELMRKDQLDEIKEAMKSTGRQSRQGKRGRSQSVRESKLFHFNISRQNYFSLRYTSSNYFTSIYEYSFTSNFSIIIILPELCVIC